MTLFWNKSASNAKITKTWKLVHLKFLKNFLKTWYIIKNFTQIYYFFHKTLPKHSLYLHQKIYVICLLEYWRLLFSFFLLFCVSTLFGPGTALPFKSVSLFCRGEEGKKSTKCWPKSIEMSLVVYIQNGPKGPSWGSPGQNAFISLRTGKLVYSIDNLYTISHSFILSILYNGECRSWEVQPYSILISELRQVVIKILSIYHKYYVSNTLIVICLLTFIICLREFCGFLIFSYCLTF